MKFTLRLTLAAGLVALSALRVSAAPPPELPVSTFFKKPSMTSLRFSPDGKRIACLIPYERRMNLAVIDLEKKTKVLLTNFKDNDVGSLRWVGNDRLIFTQDVDGQEVPAVMAVNRDGTNPAKLFGYDSTANSSVINARFRGLLVPVEDDPKSMLVLAGLSGSQGPDVGKMNLSTGRISMHVPNPGFVSRWVLDRKGQVRIGVSRKDGRTEILHRPAGGSGWEKLDNGMSGEPDAESEATAVGTWSPIGFDGDNRTLFVSSRVGRDRSAVYRYDIETRKLGGLVVEDEVYDVTDANPDYNPFPLRGLIYDDVKGKVVGFAYRRDKPTVVWFDDDFARMQKQFDASLPDTVNFILAASDDATKQLVLAQSDRDPGVYYLFDRVKKKLEELAVVKPGIDPDLMAAMQPVSFTARDGLLLRGYLTLPKGREPKNLPLVIHPHGGPYGIRDDWVFNPEVQFYANRGFAVLQIDYRGSGGYGAKFERDGYHKFGLEMQDDLSDGVKWAVDKGLADPSRVVISGASYGGYATMAGLAFTPELYVAGINYVGVTNLTTQWGKYKGTDSQLGVVHRLFGDMDKAADRKRAYDTSPVNFADRIRAPVLMAYGMNDPRVKIDQGYDMESALKKAGKPFEMLIERDEGHGFRKEELSIAFYTKVDEFLKKHVPASGANVKIGPTKTIALPAKL